MKSESARRRGGFTALCCLFALATTTLTLGAEESPASRAIILANADNPDSLRIARHYAEVRGVPTENIIAKKMPPGDVITWRQFVATIWEPLREELVAKKWIDAIPIDVLDPVGRKKYAVHRHRISALVVCRGVPLKIVHEPEFYTAHTPFTDHQEFRSNAGAVDGELGLLASNNYNINAFVPNPLYRKDTPTEGEREQVVLVGRLDGPTVEDALALIDRAVATERQGLIGRAYVDIGGPHGEGDRWFELVASQLTALGFDTEVDRQPSTIPATARADGVALYFGWYAGDVNGPFALPGFQLLPGAVTLHIHSFSATTLRSASNGWTGPFVSRGAAGVVGNVYEPYLTLTHRPELLLRALSRGANLGEAAAYSLVALSWQNVLVGDPLYRPFAVSLDEQWENRASLSPRLLGYLTLRKMHLLERAGQAAEALSLGRTIQQEKPSLALGVTLARQLQAAGDRVAARSVLRFAEGLKNLPSDEWALARDAAELMAANENVEGALPLYRTLLSAKTMPVELRSAWLKGAAKVASAARNPHLAAAWEQELAGLTEAGKR